MKHIPPQTRLLPLSLYLWMVMVCTVGSAQTPIGFFMPEDKTRVEIPFEMYNNLITVPLTINGFLTLKFILDSGAESTILTEKIFGDMLGLNYVRDLVIQGPGLMDSVQAFVATNIHLSLPGNIKGMGFNMLVLKEDYLDLKKNLGQEVYGIIGSDIFHRFVVQINYEEQIITLHRPETFKPRKYFEEIDLELVNEKPFLRSQVKQGVEIDSVNLMIDSGASHALLLDVKSTDDIELPETLIATRLGQGLGGEIPGFIGRINHFSVNQFDLENILVSIPIEGAYMKAIKRGSRHGTIGGEFLTRFEVIFDYPHQKLYLNKNSNFREPFEHNMSGITLSVTGNKLDTVVVSHVRRNSPANEVGVKKGDVISRINSHDARTSTLSELNYQLRRRDGMKIRLILIREGEKMKKVFRLKRII